MATCGLKLGKHTIAVKSWIEARPGAVPKLVSARKGSAPMAIIYKVMDKIFAILSVRGIESVILKCDSHLAQLLRKQYSGVGHRSDPDRRYWISVTLAADVPVKELKRLVSQSYDLICSKLTSKQKAELARLLCVSGGARTRVIARLNAASDCPQNGCRGVSTAAPGRTRRPSVHTYRRRNRAGVGSPVGTRIQRP